MKCSDTIVRYMLLLIGLAIGFTSCSRYRFIVMKKKTIPLFSALPDSAIAVKLDTLNTGVCYFDRREWIDYFFHPDDIEPYRTQKIKLIRAVDSTQKKEGFITDKELHQMTSQYYTPFGIEDSLLLRGHVYIKYPDGTIVKNLIYLRKDDRYEARFYFEDKLTNKVIYRHYTVLGAKF